jgi:hypothetical protein
VWPKVDSLFVMIDRLKVIDRRRRVRTTSVSVLVRTERYYSNPDSIPVEARLGAFDVKYLLRRARITDWSAHVAPSSADESAGALINLPNVPGFIRPYFKVPLKFSCIQCHRGAPKSFSRVNGEALSEDPKSFYIGPVPREEEE